MILSRGNTEGRIPQAEASLVCVRTDRKTEWLGLSKQVEKNGTRSQTGSGHLPFSVRGKATTDLEQGSDVIKFSLSK
jgi:hypothetical protein